MCEGWQSSSSIAAAFEDLIPKVHLHTPDCTCKHCPCKWTLISSGSERCHACVSVEVKLPHNLSYLCDCMCCHGPSQYLLVSFKDLRCPPWYSYGWGCKTECTRSPTAVSSHFPLPYIFMSRIHVPITAMWMLFTYLGVHVYEDIYGCYCAKWTMKCSVVFSCVYQ